MKVLIVTNTYPPADISGVGSLAQELFEGVSGAEIEVLTRVAPEGDERLHATGGSKLAFPLRAALKARLSGPGAPDIVHVNESDGVVIALWLGLRRRLEARTPRLAATFQVSYRAEAASVRSVSDAARVVSRPVLSERMFRLTRAPLLALAGRLSARLADAVVACSRYTAQEVALDYGLRAERIRVIANGLRVAPREGRSRSGAGSVRALYAGRLRTRKAVAVLLEAMARPELRDLTLWIVGDGEQRQALEAQARRLGIGERAVFRGKLARGELAKVYGDADLFVLPSIYEGFPVAILEAMAAGLPVVATRVAGIPEAVADGETGLLVPAEDAAALASAMARLSLDAKLRSKMGEAGRERFEKLFGMGRIGRAYLELWQELALASPVRRRSGK